MQTHRKTIAQDDVYDYVEELLEQRALHGPVQQGLPGSGAAAAADPTQAPAKTAAAHGRHRLHAVGAAVKQTPDSTSATDEGAAAAAAAGVSSNAEGDLISFLSSLGMNILIFLVCILMFSFLRKRFPLVYQHKVEAVCVDDQYDEDGGAATTPRATTPQAPPTQPVEDIFATNLYARTRRGERDEQVSQAAQGAQSLLATQQPSAPIIGPGGRPLPREPPDTFFGWIQPSMELTIDQINDCAGLDHALLVSYTQLAMKALFWMGLPMLLVLAPLHVWCGGHAAGEDHLSMFGFANVVEGNWLCWVHAGLVYYVIFIVQLFIFRAMRAFLPKRFAWMKEMPDPRSNTILVEGIPDDMNTTAKVWSFFDNEVFGRQVVREVYVVKDTTELAAEIAKLDALKLTLERDDGARRSVGEGASVPAQIREAEANVKRLQDYLESVDTLNTGNAFVTFRSRREANIAIKLFGEDDMEKILASAPPDPQDVIWSDLTVDPTAQAVREYIGFAMIVGLFLGTMPLVFGIASITSLDTLRDRVEFFDTIVTQYPTVAVFWEALMGAFGLTMLMGFLPTFIRIIFSTFFLLKAQAWMQLRIQQYYFYFLIIFVLLITAIGPGLISTMQVIMDDPMQVFSILGTELPRNTHFYLNYFPVQWATHGINLTRYISLMKYCVFKLFYNEKTAHQLSEPEDQDFYGIGSRSARFTLLFIIAIVFSTLSPLMIPLAFVNFAICRLLFGYLFVYAETRKPDLGGEFFVTQLRHTQQGLFLYVAVMAGCLAQRYSSWGPCAIAAGGFFPLYLSYKHFQEAFRWEALDFKEAEDADAAPRRKIKHRCYKQPELPQPDGPPAGNMFEAAQANIQRAMGDLQSRLGMAAK